MLICEVKSAAELSDRDKIALAVEGIAEEFLGLDAKNVLVSFAPVHEGLGERLIFDITVAAKTPDVRRKLLSFLPRRIAENAAIPPQNVYLILRELPAYAFKKGIRS